VGPEELVIPIFSEDWLKLFAAALLPPPLRIHLAASLSKTYLPTILRDP
jgi:hypothetical protein